MADREPEWTIEQATELALEQFVTLLDGCDDDDIVRPALVFEATRSAWAPTTEVDWDDTITAGQVRERMKNARQRLAEGELIP